MKLKLNRGGKDNLKYLSAYCTFMETIVRGIRYSLCIQF